MDSTVWIVASIVGLAVLLSLRFAIRVGGSAADIQEEADRLDPDSCALVYATQLHVLQQRIFNNTIFTDSKSDAFASECAVSTWYSFQRARARAVPISEKQGLRRQLTAALVSVHRAARRSQFTQLDTPLEDILPRLEFDNDAIDEDAIAAFYRNASAKFK